MGSNNGRASERVYNDIVERQYYNLTQATNKVNIDLGLKATDIISPQTIQYWRKMKYIDYQVIRSNDARVTAEQFVTIKAFAFFHIILGINYKKMSTAISFLSDICLDDKDKIKFLTKQIDIYDSKIRKQ